MSLLPPSLSAPVPAPGSTSSTSSASSASSTSSSRGDDASQGEGESFGDVLSRSLAASVETSAKPGGKPAAAVPVKRLNDEKADAAEAVNTAALFFVPLETRIAKTSDGATASGDGSALPSAAVNAASSSTHAAATTTAATPASAADAVAVANGADLGADAGAQAPQALLASGLAVTPAKNDALAGAATAATPASDDLAIALPAGAVAAKPGAPGDGQAQQFSGQGERPGGEAHDMPGANTRVEAEPGAPKPPSTAARDAADKAVDKTIANASPVAAADGAAQRSGIDAPTAGSSFTVHTAPPPHANAAASNSIATAASPSASQAALTPEVGSHEWDQALGRQMLHMGKAGEQVAELQLNPPGLGPLKVTLSLNDNQVQAFFVSAHASVRAAVEAALPQLRGTLADNGISLGNTSVDSGNQQQQQQAFTSSQGQDSRPASQERGQPGRQGYLASDAAVPSPAPARGSAPRGKVDIYA